ncbi:MAG TPA: hypothetical protein VIB48_13720 [Acidimicrobiia bacterium]
MPSGDHERRRVALRLATDDYDALLSIAAVSGVTVQGLLEAMLHRITMRVEQVGHSDVSEWPPVPVDWKSVLGHARQIDTERRARA